MIKFLVLSSQNSRVVNDVVAKKTSVPTTHENYNNRVNSDTECNNLFEKIKAWLINNNKNFKAKVYDCLLNSLSNIR